MHLNFYQVIPIFLFPKSIGIFFCFLFCSTILTAQPTSQRVEGTITDENGTPLIGASVLILATDPILGSTTDESGDFEILNVPHGMYEVEVSFVGYIKEKLINVDVNFNKFTRIEVALERNVDLEAVVVKPTYPTKLRSTSLQVLTIEETIRYPATFYDPARLATAHPGILSSNDQANNLIIRGNSPNSMNWYLEGAEIVNPNHLSNAGTMSDRITTSGGGVNILSAQLMKKADFYTSAFPTAYGNALAGIMDVDIRKGKYDRHHQTAQIGLLGIDIAAEGPAAKDNDDAYLINYRYATIGLLSDLGVDLGDEEISFQDLAFNLVLPSRSIGTISLFGMGGISKNIFETKRDTSQWEFEKDRSDIRYENKMGAIGLTHNWDMEKGHQLKTTFVISGLDADRTGTLLNDDFQEIFSDKDQIIENKWSFHSRYAHQLGQQQTLTAGLRFTAIETEFLYTISNFTQNFGDHQRNLWQPYINYKTRIRNKLELNAGLHFLNYAFADVNLFEPRFFAKYNLNDKSNFSLAYGLHSMLQQPQIYFTSASPIYTNEELTPTRAHHFVLGYYRFLNSFTSISMEGYHQELFDVPVDQVDATSFSALNMMEGYVLNQLENSGTGKNYGVELSLKRFLTNDLFYLFNVSLYESKYKGSDGIERDTRFNGNYIINATIGKEFLKLKSRKEETKRRVLGFNIRGLYAGGFRETPIDEVISSQTGTTVYDDNNAFSQNQRDYFKIDFRFYRTIVSQNMRSTIAIDLQNATNQKNIAFNYFDALQGVVVKKYQLGIIPNISYKIEL